MQFGQGQNQEFFTDAEERIWFWRGRAGRREASPRPMEESGSLRLVVREELWFYIVMLWFWTSLLKKHVENGLAHEFWVVSKIKDCYSPQQTDACCVGW
jgi:hypothetical protein